MANKNEVKLIVTADTTQANSSIQGFGAQLKSHWLELSAMAAGAFFTIRKIYSEFAAAAEREEKRIAFGNLAATFHTNADSIIADLKRMSGQSITTSSAIELAGKSMLSGLDPHAMSGLMEFAKTTTRITGGKAADTFEDLTRAIITGQDRMLRMHGITVDFDKAQKDLATSLGGTKEQLNAQQIQYANLTALLETADTMTQRLGGGMVSMNDKISKTSTEMSESLEHVKDSIYQTFGDPALLILKEFARELDQTNYLINFGKAAYERVKGLFSGNEAATTGVGAENFQPPNVKGITSVKGLGFTFDEQLGPGLQSLKDYTEEMKKNLGELLKTVLTKKQLSAAREAEIQMQLRQIDLMEQEFQLSKADATSDRITKTKELITVQEEYAKTLDKSLDPASWYAQQKAIDDTRESLIRLNLEAKKQTGTFTEGFSYGFQKFEQDAKTSFEYGQQMAEDTANAIGQTFENISFDAMQGKLKTLGDYFKSFLTSIQHSVSNILGQMMTQLAMTGLSAAFGSFSFGGGGGSVGANQGSSVGWGDVGAAIRGTGPTGPRRLPGSGGSFGGGVKMHSYNISITNTFMDPTGIEKYKEVQERQIHNTIKKLRYENKI